MKNIKADKGLPSFIQATETLSDTSTSTIFGSRALFIVLIAIGCVSIVVIIAGFIYLICDRKRSRSGEYITNNTNIVNADLEMAFDNPAMAEMDKTTRNGNQAHLLSFKTDEGEIVPYDSFNANDIMSCEVEDTHL